MKRSSHTLRPTIKATLVAVISFNCFQSDTFAQTKTNTRTDREASIDPATRSIQQCIALMEQEQWQTALDLVNKLITESNGKGVETHGAKFGTSYYYRGLCMLKLAQH